MNAFALPRNHFIFRCLAVVMLLLPALYGCRTEKTLTQPGLTTPSYTQENLIPSSRLQETGTRQEELEPASLIINNSLPGTAAPDPLRFSFPTPRPAPGSAWRPPLYPTPWALSPYDHFYFARPIAADEINWPEADYRYGGTFFENVVHTGVDISVSEGTPVLAAGSGKVMWAGYGLYRGGEDPTDPYGLAVAIRHDFGYQGEALYTVYGHLSRVDVARGQQVSSGQVLGLSGQTGRVTGPHLHFEVRVTDNDYFTTRNPELWLVPPQGWGVLAGRVMDGWGVLLHGQIVNIVSKTTGQIWTARSYGASAVHSDPYYQENLVIGDLPAGMYEIHIPFYGSNMEQDIEILAGKVNYFTFSGYDGFRMALPEAPGADFTPAPLPSP